MKKEQQARPLNGANHVKDRVITKVSQPEGLIVSQIGQPDRTEQQVVTVKSTSIPVIHRMLCAYVPKEIASALLIEGLGDGSLRVVG